MTEHELWTAFGTSAELPDCIPPVPWFTPFENARLAGFRIPKRRREWFLGRCTAKRLVNEAAPDVLRRALSPEEFEIASEDSGAPFARLVSGVRLPIGITLSHSHGAAFCALLPADGDEGAIGGDIECLEPRSHAFVRDFFTAAEAAAREESPSAERSLFTNAIWSAKESVLKALGLGLSVDTREVEIRLSKEPADVPLRPRTEEWRRFDVAFAAGIEAGEIPVSGLWTVRGRFVVTLAVWRPAHPGKVLHAHPRIQRNNRDVRTPGNDRFHGNLRPRAA